MRSARAAGPRQVEPDPAVPGDLIELGAVVDAWGVRGWLKVKPRTVADESALLLLKQCWTDRRRHLSIEQAKPHGTWLVIQFDGITERDAALALKGATLLGSRAEFAALEPDEFYVADLLGCAVFDAAGRPLGTVSGLTGNGAHDLLIVDAGSRLPVMIPLVAERIVRIDPAARRIDVDWAPDAL